MKNLFANLPNGVSRKVWYSYFVTTSLIYFFVFFYYLSCIYLSFNEEYKNTLFIVGSDISIFTTIYIGILLILQPVLFISKLMSFNNLYTIYFAGLFGFILNLMSLYLYNDWTRILIIILFAIALVMVFIQKEHFLKILKSLSTKRKILIIILSITNLFSFSEIVFMGQTINLYW
jgi:hypothetical protein